MNIESSQKLEQNKVSIVYAGTPVLSKKILEKLTENFEIKAVLTQPDKIRGRTKIPSLAPVAEFAVKNNIECIKIENFQQNNLLKLNNLKFRKEKKIINIKKNDVVILLLSSLI